MTEPNWQPLASTIVVNARPVGLWTRAVDYVAGPRKLKITADPTLAWTLGSSSTGPDGDPNQSPNANALPLLPSALLGSLIAKIGGSAADNTAPVVSAAGLPPVAPIGVPTPFSIGSFCILEIPATQKGSLFLTMNDTAGAFAQHSGSLTVNIFEAL
jgi:hypothetical protein